MPSRPRLRCFNKQALWHKSAPEFGCLGSADRLSVLAQQARYPACSSRRRSLVSTLQVLYRVPWGPAAVAACRSRTVPWVHHALVDSCLRELSCNPRYVTLRRLLSTVEMSCRLSAVVAPLRYWAAAMCLRICVRVESVVLSLLLALPATALLSLSLFSFPAGPSARG